MAVMRAMFSSRLAVATVMASPSPTMEARFSVPARAALFLRAAIHKDIRQDALFDIQGADTLGRVELMAREGEHIHPQSLDIHRDVADRLDGIGMEPGAHGRGR